MVRSDRRVDRYNEGLEEGRRFSENLNRAMVEANRRTNGAYKAKASGDYGEYSISTIFNALPEEFHVINNVMLKTKKGTTQIDHIVVSPYGIYIVETKNHKGMIFGGPDSKVWTQVLYGANGRVEHFTFYNPLWQNRGHIENLSRSIGVPVRYMTGLVVFNSKDVNIDNARPWCMTPDEAFNFMMSNSVIGINNRDLNVIIDRIDKVNISSYRNSQAHIEYVNSIKEAEERHREMRRILGY